MGKAWNCELLEKNQLATDSSFIGGIPKLPTGTSIPICTLCGHEMTFMFQIAFPEGHIWEGKTFALFFCLDCFGDEYCIPEMPQGSSLYQVEIPEGFLDTYQRNFRFFVFDTKDGEPLQNYKGRIPFQQIEITPDRRNSRDAIFTLGGRPIWIMGQDETPGKYAGTEKLEFLFQIKEDFKFPKLENAPPQADPFSPNNLSIFPWYDLFARNRIYFWGTSSQDNPKVYISVQKL